jgi:Fic family protein
LLYVRIGSVSYRPFPSFAAWAELEINDAVYDPYADLLASARAGAAPTAMTAAVDRATRFAAIDTGAIEGLYEVDRGFTRTVATEAAAWAALATTRGDQVKNAIYDALDAYELVLDLATRSERLTEVSIRGLHEVICRSQETYAVYTAAGRQEHPLPRGEYKRFPNNPTNLRSGEIHDYAPPVDTPAEMHRLVRELSSPGFEAAHPVLQAAYAHYAFVCVHPFADGNGRVARALASAYLYRSPGVPLLIFADQKDPYIDVLEVVDAGDPRGFVHFMLQRVLDVIDLIRSFLRVPGGQLAVAASGRDPGA